MFMLLLSLLFGSFGCLDDYAIVISLLMLFLLLLLLLGAFGSLDDDGIVVTSLRID